MSPTVSGSSSSWSTVGLGLAVSALTLSVVLYPHETLEASAAGLELWWRSVLPALFPFFVLAELLAGLGVIRAVGVLLEPVMRPLFRIPGEGAFALAMGLASGCPLGAKITARLVREGACTREEGERLLAFANTSNPLFIMGAVAVGMFGSATIGVTLAAAHYLAVLCVGIAFRFHAGGRMSGAPRSDGPGVLRRAAEAMATERRRDRRPPGALFADAVRDTMATMLFIGGCIMFFSVLIRMAEVSGLLAIVARPAEGWLTALGSEPGLVSMLLAGLVEVTNGAQNFSEWEAPLLLRLIAVSFLLGWSGLSIHSQVAAMVHGTGLRLVPYWTGRLLHGLFAALFTRVLYPLITESAFATAPLIHRWAAVPSYGAGVAFALLAAGALLGAGCVLSLLVAAARRVRILIWRI